MQVSEPERNTFDDWIRWALTTGSRNVQPPDQVWQRIADRVASLDGEEPAPRPPCQRCVRVGSKS